MDPSSQLPQLFSAQGPQTGAAGSDAERQHQHQQPFLGQTHQQFQQSQSQPPRQQQQQQQQQHQQQQQQQQQQHQHHQQQPQPSSSNAPAMSVGQAPPQSGPFFEHTMRLFDLDVPLVDSLFGQPQSFSNPSALGEVVQHADRPHPRGLVCAGPTCDRTHSISWVKPTNPHNLPWENDPGKPMDEDDMYLCFHCCALYALQGAEAPVSHPQQPSQQSYQQQQQQQQQNQHSQQSQQSQYHGQQHRQQQQSQDNGQQRPQLVPLSTSDTDPAASVSAPGNLPLDAMLPDPDTPPPSVFASQSPMPQQPLLDVPPPHSQQHPQQPQQTQQQQQPPQTQQRQRRQQAQQKQQQKQQQQQQQQQQPVSFAGLNSMLTSTSLLSLYNQVPQLQQLRHLQDLAALDTSSARGQRPLSTDLHTLQQLMQRHAQPTSTAPSSVPSVGSASSLLNHEARGLSLEKQSESSSAGRPSSLRANRHNRRAPRRAPTSSSPSAALSETSGHTSTGSATSSRRGKIKYKCPACLSRNGEFKYFGLSVRICKACYQLWTHHEGFRKQHTEEMDEHIRKCIKNGDSQRRLRVIFDLKASASGKNPNPTPVQSIKEVTLVLTGRARIEQVLLRVIEAALRVYSGLFVEVLEATLRPASSPLKSKVVLFLKGASDHMNGAIVKVQDTCRSIPECTYTVFDGRQAEYTSSSSSDEGWTLPQAQQPEQWRQQHASEQSQSQQQRRRRRHEGSTSSSNDGKRNGHLSPTDGPDPKAARVEGPGARGASALTLSSVFENGHSNSTSNTTGGSPNGTATNAAQDMAQPRPTQQASPNGSDSMDGGNSPANGSSSSSSGGGDTLAKETRAVKLQGEVIESGVFSFCISAVEASEGVTMTISKMAITHDKQRTLSIELRFTGHKKPVNKLLSIIRSMCSCLPPSRVTYSAK